MNPQLFRLDKKDRMHRQCRLQRMSHWLFGMLGYRSSIYMTMTYVDSVDSAGMRVGRRKSLGEKNPSAGGTDKGFPLDLPQMGLCGPVQGDLGARVLNRTNLGKANFFRPPPTQSISVFADFSTIVFGAETSR
jgi:hypothetical protein